VIIPPFYYLDYLKGIMLSSVVAEYSSTKRVPDDPIYLLNLK